MAMQTAARPSIFAIELRDVRLQQGLSWADLALCMIQSGFPSYLYSAQPADSDLDRAWLADRIREAEGATLSHPTWSDPWLLGPNVIEFIDRAAACMPRVFWVSVRLFMAFSIDELARHDP